MFAIRRSRLKHLIDTDPLAKGNQAAFAERLGYTRAQISQYLSSTYNKGKSPGEQVARALEEKAGKPPLWLDGCEDLTRGWPFPEIPREAFDALPREAQGQVATVIKQLVSEHQAASQDLRRVLSLRQDQLRSLLSTADALDVDAPPSGSEQSPKKQRGRPRVASGKAKG